MSITLVSKEKQKMFIHVRHKFDNPLCGTPLANSGDVKYNLESIILEDREKRPNNNYEGNYEDDFFCMRFH